MSQRYSDIFVLAAFSGSEKRNRTSVGLRRIPAVVTPRPGAFFTRKKYHPSTPLVTCQKNCSTISYCEISIEPTPQTSIAATTSSDPQKTPSRTPDPPWNPRKTPTNDIKSRRRCGACFFFPVQHRTKMSYVHQRRVYFVLSCIFLKADCVCSLRFVARLTFSLK